MTSELSGLDIIALKRRLDSRYLTLRTRVREILLGMQIDADTELGGRRPVTERRFFRADLPVVFREEVERCQREMAEIEAAFISMEQNRYGQCVDCGSSIGRGRLRAFPAASRCERCRKIAGMSAHGPFQERPQIPK